MPTARPRCDPASAAAACPGLEPSLRRSRCPESQPGSGQPSSRRYGWTDLKQNQHFISAALVDSDGHDRVSPLYPCSASLKSILVMGLKSTSHSRMQPSRPPVAKPSSQACMLKIPAWKNTFSQDFSRVTSLLLSSVHLLLFN